jgi:hypothetical protein
MVLLPAGDGNGDGEIVTLRTELRLAHPSIEPLARPASDPDPLQAFAAAVATLRPDRGEEATVCLDLLPATGRRGTRLRRRRLRRQARGGGSSCNSIPTGLGGIASKRGAAGTQARSYSRGFLLVSFTLPAFSSRSRQLAIAPGERLIPRPTTPEVAGSFARFLFM